MNTKTHLVRPAALALVLWGAASVALAGYAQLDWTSRDGQGSILYNLDVPDSDPTFRQGLFIDNIVSYDILGWDENTVPRRFTGTGGSLFIRSWPSTGCPATFDCASEGYDVSFQLGTPEPGDAGLWQVNFNLGASGENPDGPMPFFETFGWDHGYLSNPLDDRTYSAQGLAGRVTHQAVAAPVPEPGTVLMFGLGLFAVGWAARARRGTSLR